MAAPEAQPELMDDENEQQSAMEGNDEARQPLEVNVHELFAEPEPPAPIEWQGLLPFIENKIKEMVKAQDTNFARINRRLDYLVDTVNKVANRQHRMKGNLRELVPEPEFGANIPPMEAPEPAPPQQQGNQTCATR
ncbi:unnamed protein product [Cylicocyclus nassatus]|uniref:Uncharacterized protein n=1 Tax=Cylicocyclus nassatus TaxID=53992 RepID=A0AA36GM68_CYLNA|nr:unnamed protein product [Cylicocyclus nassatus]